MDNRFSGFSSWNDEIAGLTGAEPPVDTWMPTGPVVLKEWASESNEPTGISPFTVLMLIVCLLLIAAFIYNVVMRFRSRMHCTGEEEDE